MVVGAPAEVADGGMVIEPAAEAGVAEEAEVGGPRTRKSRRGADEDAARMAAGLTRRSVTAGELPKVGGEVASVAPWARHSA